MRCLVDIFSSEGISFTLLSSLIAEGSSRISSLASVAVLVVWTSSCYCLCVFSLTERGWSALLSAHPCSQRASFHYRDFSSDHFFSSSMFSSFFVSWASECRLFVYSCFSVKHLRLCGSIYNYCRHLGNWHVSPYLCLLHLILNSICDVVFNPCTGRSKFIATDFSGAIKISFCCVFVLILYCLKAMISTYLNFGKLVLFGM